jgi:RimJ/RimL family protein N-acetyltransferase
MPLVSNVAGSPTEWTLERQEAFREFHRRRREGLEGPCREVGFAIVAEGEAVGVARLARQSDGTHEVGLWLGRSYRGRGIGTAALVILRTKAAELGVSVLRAETTTANAAALGVFRNHGAVLSAGPQDEVHATIE